jgi:hypothetical protein
MEKLSKREMILALLADFIKQRPGLEFANYGDVSAYRSEMRSITADRHVAERLLAQVSWRSGIGEAQLRVAFRAFSGRLTLTDLPDGRMRLDYCTGQYFPTEYRKAVCAVLSAALWDYFRDQCMPEPVLQDDGDRMYPAPSGKGLVSAGDWLRTTARRELGAPIARRWFS